MFCVRNTIWVLLGLSGCLFWSKFTEFVDYFSFSKLHSVLPGGFVCCLTEQSAVGKVSQLLSISLLLFLHADEVDLLDKITSHAQDLSNVSFGHDEANCSILEIGQYATLNIPTREAFGDR